MNAFRSNVGLQTIAYQELIFWNFLLLSFPQTAIVSLQDMILFDSYTGIEYLHSNRTNKPPLFHQNLSATKVLIDRQSNPLLSGSGIHKLLADDVVFSTLKTSAAMGYLAPEYATVGRFTEKSDVYAFGVIVFQILTGKTRITHLESGKLEDLIDENLQGNYPKPEAAKLAGVALLCTSEVPDQRPTMEAVFQELSSINSSSSY